MKINTNELRAVFEALMSHLEGTATPEVQIDWDYYWDIPVEELYNPYETPQNLDLGQLSEDWQKLQEIASGSQPSVSYALTWLAAVLRAVGEKTFA